MLELQNFFKMKDFFAENFGNFWKKVVLRKISGTFVFEKFSGKIFAFRKIFFGGALEWKGAQLLEYTPQPETGWHGPGFQLKYFFQLSVKKIRTNMKYLQQVTTVL